MPPTFKPSIGKQRIPSSDTSDAAGFTRDIRGQMQQILKNYVGLVDHMDKHSVDVVYEALQPTFEETQRIVPKDTGELKASGYLIKSTFRGNAQVEIGYGRGGNPPYAAVVHENLEYRHESPTKAKYLEGPLAEDEEEIQARIVKGMKDISGG